MSERLRTRGVVQAPGPGPGEGLPAHRLAVIVARIAVAATIVVGQLWALTVMLNAYLSEEMRTVWWLLGFEALSFALALAVWLASPSDR
jgi:hypothetical protein